MYHTNMRDILEFGTRSTRPIDAKLWKKLCLWIIFFKYQNISSNISDTLNILWYDMFNKLNVTDIIDLLKTLYSITSDILNLWFKVFGKEIF